MRHLFRGLAAATLIAVLSGCQSLPAAPEHKYYRLLPEAAAPAARAVLSGELVVRPLRAEGLYSERAIVFSDEEQRRLQQYHYHHWLYPPGQLVQEHLAGWLAQTGIAPRVRLQDRGGESPYAVTGRIVRFEKIIVGGKAKASVALDLRLENKGRVLWQRSYAASRELADASMNGFAAAMEDALQLIYTEFVADLGEAVRS